MAQYKYSVDVRTDLDNQSVDNLYRKLEQQLKQDFKLDVDLNDRQILKSLNILYDAGKNIKNIFGSIKINQDYFDFKFDEKINLKSLKEATSDISHVLNLLKGQFTEVFPTLQKGTVEYTNGLSATINATKKVFERFGEEIARVISQDIPLPFEELVPAANAAAAAIHEVKQEIKDDFYDDSYSDAQQDIKGVALSAEEATKRLTELNNAFGVAKGKVTKSENTFNRLKSSKLVDYEDLKKLETRLGVARNSLSYADDNRNRFGASRLEKDAIGADEDISRVDRNSQKFKDILDDLKTKYGEVISAASKGDKAFNDFIANNNQVLLSQADGTKQLVDMTEEASDKIVDANKQVASSYGEVNKAQLEQHLSFLNQIAERRKVELGADISKISGVTKDGELVGANISYFRDGAKQATVDYYKLVSVIDETAEALGEMGQKAEEAESKFIYDKSGFTDNIKRYQDELDRKRNAQINLEKQQSRETLNLRKQLLALETSALSEGSAQTLWSDQETENFREAKTAIEDFKRELAALNSEIGSLSKEDFNKRIIDINDRFAVTANEIKNMQLSNRTGTDLKSKDVATSVDLYKTKVNSLIADVQNAGLNVGDLKKQLVDLYDTINGENDKPTITDSGAFDTFQNEYRKAQAEYQKVKRIYSAGKLESVDATVSDLEKVYGNTKLSEQLAELKSDIKSALQTTDIEEQHKAWLKIRDDVESVNIEVEKFDANQSKINKLYSDLNASLARSGGYSVEMEKALPGSATHEHYSTMANEEIKKREEILKLIKVQNTVQADLISSDERQAEVQRQIATNAALITKARAKQTDIYERELTTAEQSADAKQSIEAQRTLNELYNQSNKSLQRMGELQAKMAKTDKKSDIYSEYKSQLEAEGENYNNIALQIQRQTKLQADAVSSEARENEELKQVLANRNAINESLTKYNAGLDASYKKITDNFNAKDKKTDADRYRGMDEGQVNVYGGRVDEVQQLIHEVKDLEQGTKEYYVQLEKIIIAYDNLLVLEKQMKGSGKVWNARLQEDINQGRLVQQIQDHFTKYRDTFKHDPDYLKRYEDFLNKISSKGYEGNTKQLRADFVAIREAGRGIGSEAVSLFQGFKDLFNKHFGTALVMSALQLIRTALRGIYENVVNIDKAMTELRKVSEASLRSLNKYLTTTGEKAAKLGTTISALINATAGFARLGKNLEDADKLGQLATLLYEVGDMENIKSAISVMVSSMAAFDVDVDGAEAIVDKINAISNDFSIEAEGLAAAISRSASALALAGNDLNQSMALITAGNVVVQDPESVGTALKVLSLRIRGTKTELDKMGESTEDMAATTSSLREQIKALSGVDIMINSSKFKETYQILKEISAVYDDLDDTKQAAILEKLAGKTRANTIASVLTNFETAEKAYATSLNSAGSALEENEKRLDSIGGKQAQFKAQFEDLSLTIMNSELIKGALDTGTGLLGTLTAITKFIDSMTPRIGKLTPLVAALGAALSFKNVGWLKMKSDKLCLTTS